MENFLYYVLYKKQHYKGNALEKQELDNKYIYTNKEIENEKDICTIENKLADKNCVATIINCTLLSKEVTK